MRNRIAPLLTTLALAWLPACAAPAPSATGTAEDEQAIRAMVNQYSAGYAAKDTAAMAALVTADYEVVDPTGRHIQGRDAFIQTLAQEFAMMPAGGSMSGTTTFVRWIDANHAVAGGTWEIGPAMPGMPSKGSWGGVMVKENGTWKMMSGMGSPDLTPLMTDTTRSR